MPNDLRIQQLTLALCLAVSCAFNLNSSNQSSTLSPATEVTSPTKAQVEVTAESKLEMLENSLAELNLIVAKVSGCKPSVKILRKIERIEKVYSQLLTTSCPKKAGVLAAELKTNFFSLGRAVAKHPRQKAFRFHFWRSFDLAAKALCWPPEVRTDLSTEMFYAAMDSKLLSTVKKSAGAFFGIVNFFSNVKNCWQLMALVNIVPALKDKVEVQPSFEVKSSVNEVKTFVNVPCQLNQTLRTALDILEPLTTLDPDI
jgi:hypothetical protein